MAGLLDDHGSGYHPVVATGGGDDSHRDGWWGGIWIFALIVIFLAVILMYRKDHDGYKRDCGMEGIIPALTVGALNKQPAYPVDGCCGGGCKHEIWDVERDQMREFCNVRQEIKDTAFAQARDSDRYFYENRAATDRGFYDNRFATDRGFYEQRAATEQSRYDALLGFKNTEILGLQNTGNIIKEINAMRDEMKEDRLRAQGNRITYLETVMALQPKAPMPAFIPNYGFPVHNTFVAEHAPCA